MVEGFRSVLAGQQVVEGAKSLRQAGVNFFIQLGNLEEIILVVSKSYNNCISSICSVLRVI